MATTTLPLSDDRQRARPGILYPHAQWYFLAAMATTWLGFARSYFSVVRTEPLLHHLHGALMGGWIALLVIQPILYQRGRLALHRTLGRWGVYALTPAIVIVGLLMDRRMLHLHTVPPSVLDQLAFLDLGSLILFPLFIALSIFYARDLGLHARYIVCTVLLLMPPAWGRALGWLPWIHSFKSSVDVAQMLVGLVFLILIADDLRRGRLRAAYPVGLVLFAAVAAASEFARSWGWWHGVTRLIGD